MAEDKPLQQAMRPMPWRTQTQTAAIVALILIVAIIIGALYLAQATVTATTGRELEDLSKTRDYLQRGNEDVIAEIANKRSITNLQGRAQELGYLPITADQIEYLVVNGYAPNRATPTPEVTAQPTYVYDETFTGWVQQQWDSLVKQFET